MLDAFAGRPFDVFAGSERFLLANLRGGGAGCITATGNVNAAAIVQLFKEWSTPGADELQQQLNRVRSVIERYAVIPALKAIIAHFSGDSTWRTVRPPLSELASADAQSLVGDLRKAGFAMTRPPV